MARLGGVATTLTASTDVTILTTTGIASVRLLVMNLDSVSHDYPIKLGTTQVGVLKGIPAGEEAVWGPHNVAASTAVKVTAPATTTTASQCVATGEDDA